MNSTILILASSIGLFGHWEGIAELQGKQWNVAVDYSEDASRAQATVDFPDFGIYGHPLARRHAEGREIEFTCALQDRMVRLTGVMDGDTIDGRLDIYGTKTDLHLERLQEAPGNLTLQEVSCANGDVELAGTLVLPDRPGHFPGIVLTHGSGAQNRSTTFYRSRAIFFARQGIAALTYDKRGVGRSSGDWKTATFKNLAEDAVCWVEALKSKKEIDPDRIGIEGSSQGGWIAPMAATLSPDIAFIVVGSAPGITPAEQNNFSVRSALTTSGVDDGIVREIASLRERLDIYYATGEGRQDASAALESVYARHGAAPWFKDTWLPPLPLGEGGPGTDNHYTADNMLLEPDRYWSRVAVPVLAMWGENDRDVPAQLSMESLKASLERAENSRSSFHIFSQSGHGFRKSAPAGTWDFPRLAPEYTRTLNAWLRKHVLTPIENVDSTQ